MKQIKRWSFLIIAVLATAGTGISTTTAVAQEADESPVLDEVTVTARKRAENLQDVAMSVGALNVDDIAKRFDIDLQTLQNAAPNLVISDIQQGPGSPAAISIRGVGTTDVEKNFDPTVGVVVDGVFIGVNSGAMLKAIDLTAVEILRGPQGTLFGRNSIGGVINVRRGRPDFDGTSGSIRAGAGRFGDMQLEGFVNVTASDKVAFRLGAAQRQNDGWFHNSYLGRDVGESEYTVISPSITFRPIEDVEIYYRYDRTQQKQDANTLQNLAQPSQVFCFYHGQCAQGLSTPQSGSDYTVLQNDDPPYQTYFDTDSHIINASWSINESYSLDYVFGDFSTDEQVYQDWDATPLTLYHTDRPAIWEQQSHELRLNYSGDRLSYTAGIYLWDSEYSIDLLSYIGFVDFLYGLPAGTVLEVAQSVAQSTDSQAFFVEADYQISDQWTLTVGGRYTSDDKDSAVQDVLMPELAVEGGPGNPFKESWNEFTPKLSLRYQANEDLMLYGLYSEGFRAGGFNGRPGTHEAASIPYHPETVENLEFGMKSEWLGGRLRINGSIFQMDYKDKQEEQSVPTSQGTGQQTVVVNAAKASINGLEVDFNFLVNDIFTLEGNLGLLDAEFDELTHPSGVDLSHLKLRRAPDMTATISPVFTWGAGNGEFSARAALRYVDDMEYTFLNSPQSHAPAHSTIDASVSYSTDKYSVSLWGLNLGEDDSWTQGYDVGADLGFDGLWTYTAIRPPRSYGVVFSYNF